MSNTATFIKDCSKGFRGIARLYRLDPPTVYIVHDDDLKLVAKTSEYVVVSGANTLDHGPETYIFPSDADGNVTDWGELNGSFVGSIDHGRALRDAGYDIAET